MVRGEVYVALGRIQAAESVQRLLGGLEDSSPAVREAALFAIGQLGLARGATAIPEFVEPLTLLIESEQAGSALERLAAIEALGQAGAR